MLLWQSCKVKHKGCLNSFSLILTYCLFSDTIFLTRKAVTNYVLPLYASPLFNQFNDSVHSIAE